MTISRFKEQLLFFSWAVSFLATAGSLYFSEIMNYIPCELCWYQRIFMYPLVIILGGAIIKKDASQALYGMIFSGIGACISFYHYLLQKVPGMAVVDSCGIIPCSGQYINWIGFVTIPFLALTAFIIIFIGCLMILIKK